MKKDLCCADCGKQFYISDKDEAFYKKMNYILPKRCLDCRRRRKLEKEKKENE